MLKISVVLVLVIAELQCSVMARSASETLTNMRIRTRAEVKRAGSLLTDFMEAGSLTLALTSRREVVTRPCCVSRLL